MHFTVLPLLAALAASTSAMTPGWNVTKTSSPFNQQVGKYNITAVFVSDA
jgi:hypothetical protein